MTWTPDSFRTRFVEFAAVDDVLVQDSLDEAELEVSADAWGSQYDRGTGYLAAHLLKIRITIEGGDPNLESLVPQGTRTIGDVSITSAAYLVNLAKGGALNLTPYGKEYFRIRPLVAFGGIAIG